jgi:hypothetical protein
VASKYPVITQALSNTFVGISFHASNVKRKMSAKGLASMATLVCDEISHHLTWKAKHIEEKKGVQTQSFL